MQRTSRHLGKIFPAISAGVLLFVVSTFGVLANPPEQVYANGDPHTVTLAYDDSTNGSITFDAAVDQEDPTVKSLTFSPGEKVGITFLPFVGYKTISPQVTYQGVVEENNDSQTVGQLNIPLDEGSAVDNHIVFTMPDHDVEVSASFEQGSFEVIDPESTEAQTITTTASERVADALGLEEREPTVQESIAMFFGQQVDLSPTQASLASATVLQTFVDPEGMPDDLTINDMFKYEEYYSHFIVSIPSTTTLFYSSDPNDEYVYGYVSGTFTPGTHIYDYAAAYNNNEGQVLSDDQFRLDTETGIFAVKKDAYMSYDDGSTLEIQLLLPNAFNFETAEAETHTISIDVESERPDVSPVAEVYKMDASPFLDRLTIPVVSAADAPNVSLNDFTFQFDTGSYPINAAAYNEEFYEENDGNAVVFNNATGELTIAAPPFILSKHKSHN